MKWPTDPGFLRPRDSSKGPIRRRNCASSSPRERSPRRRWSGPRAWQPGKKPGIFRACSRAPRARRPFRDPVARQCSWRPWRRAAFDRASESGTSPGAVLLLMHRPCVRHPAAVGRDRCTAAGSFPACMSRSGQISASPAGAVDLMWFYAAVVLFVVMRRRSIRGCSTSRPASVQVLLYWLVIKWFIAQPQLERATARAQLLGLILGLSWLEPAGLRFRHHHHRLGVGLLGANAMDVPPHRRHAARRGFQRHRARSSLAFDPDRRSRCVFIIPIPWMMRWFGRWFVSQIVLVERTA